MTSRLRSPQRDAIGTILRTSDLQVANQWKQEGLWVTDVNPRPQWIAMRPVDLLEAMSEFSPTARQRRQRQSRGGIVLTAFGETKTIAQWADDARCAVSACTLRSRYVKCGWPAEESIAVSRWDRRG